VPDTAWYPGVTIREEVVDVSRAGDTAGDTDEAEDSPLLTTGVVIEGVSEARTPGRMIQIRMRIKRRKRNNIRIINNFVFSKQKSF